MADTAVDLSQSMERLTANEAAYSGFTHKWKVKYTDIDEGTGATDTVTVKLYTTTADWMVTRAAWNVVTAFAGAASQALTAELGTDGDPNNFIESAAVTAVGPKIHAAAGNVATLAGSFAAASDILQIKFTNATAGSPSELTAGEIDVYLGIVELNNCG